jgi:NADH:ubiquinone oxidoreductase subunit 4 (subunit M)
MKEKAQFYVALASVGSLGLVTMASLVRDSLVAAAGETTQMLSGGLIAVCSAACGWLFRNGNGTYPDTPK